MVEIIEVGDDDGDREGYGEDSGDGAHGTDQLAPGAERLHVAIANGRHGNDRPPESLRDAGKVGVRGVGICKVDGTGKEHDADEEEEYQKAELSHAGTDGASENLQAWKC